ncbi:MAG TPA: hypothetical protein VKV29_09435 [Chthonomonas sp.]|jgi:hypothetical protein|uniref:hypothetical protein n=1 Tax=Chthonomonas sp. TaxID=2282153 RepID=UPI002B4AAF75|nr:hypothetical protein [Chthonomonas sp.]HLH80488.1 hypothetical protein [Chthonomonas sp.]
MQNGQEQLCADVPVPKDAVVWQVHLLRSQPQKLPFVGAVVLLGVLSAWVLFGQLLLALVALILLCKAAGEYLFPITYRLDADGVWLNGFLLRQGLQWQEAKRLVSEENGFYVSPFAVASPLERFRGLHLRFANDGSVGDRAMVLGAIARWAPHLINEAL